MTGHVLSLEKKINKNSMTLKYKIFSSLLVGPLYIHSIETANKERDTKASNFQFNSSVYSLMEPSISLKTLLTISLFLFFVTPQSSLAVKLPFHPQDLLPLLPRQVSWPILNRLHGAVDLLPTFVGAASALNETGDWKGACFYENRAWMEFHNKTGSEFGGGTLHLKVLKMSTFGSGFC